MKTKKPLLLASILFTLATAAVTQVQIAQPLERLYVVAAEPGGPGVALRVFGGPPWGQRLAGTTDGGRIARRFGARHFVINSEAGTITLPRGNAGLPLVHDIGPNSAPQDILVVEPIVPGTSHGLVTRRHDPHLLWLNLDTGQGADVVDLSPLGGADPIALGTMARDGNYLFVQVRVHTTNGNATPGGSDTGLLGVIDLANMTLVDVDPAQVGVQGIALQGAPPRLKMQIIEATRTMYVSTTEGVLDARGGIELVNLDTWQSVGYALSEAQIGDLGGFVMTSPQEGYFVFHTDLLPSTHLKHFTVAAGPEPGPEMIVLLGAEQDVIAYDPRFERIFLPSGGSDGAPAVHVFDALTQLPVGVRPILTRQQPYDVLIED